MNWIGMVGILAALGGMAGAADECFAPVPCEPEFVAYETKAPAEWAGIVADEFGPHALRATRIRRLGAPIAPADTGGIHALGYEIDGVPAPGVARTYDTRFGRVTGELREARFLFTPATKSVTSTPPGQPPADAPGTYLCYGYRATLGSRTPVCMTDQFGDRCASLGRTAHVCLPASPTTTATLVCLTAKDSGPQDADVLVWGALEATPRPLNLDPADEVCVIATPVP
jgi:hypothetical protein